MKKEDLKAEKAEKVELEEEDEDFLDDPRCQKPKGNKIRKMKHFYDK